MELNREEILKLIQAYRIHRLLWDTKDRGYFSKAKKKDAWENIGKLLNIDKDDARKKMSSLLGSFRREKAKGRKIIAGTNEVYRSDWFAFNSFSFLMDKGDPCETINSEQIKDEIVHFSEVQDIHQSLNFRCSSAENSSEMSRTENTQIENLNNFLEPLTSRRKRAKVSVQDRREEDTRIRNTFEFTRQPIEPEDSTTIFTKYLATKLNQFDPRTKSALIFKINQLIFETEMNMYPDCSQASPYFTPVQSPPL